MVVVEHIYKSFDNLTVLKDISFSVTKGEVVSIVGPSGAGKTTLLQLLGTLDKPDFRKESNIIIDNEKIVLYNSKQLAQFRNKKIGFIFQFHQLLPEFTALENVCLPAFIAGTDKKTANLEAIKWLEYLGLQDRMHHKPSMLSGGEQQRVAVARALINKPALILADEPSGNLDTQAAENLHQLFFKLRKDFQQTFIIVTHNETLAKMSDRIIKMKDGKIV